MDVPAIIQPKRPSGKGWHRLGPLDASLNFGYGGEQWVYESGLMVISTVEVASDPHDKINKGPEYHVSCSMPGPARCDRNAARFVKKAFAMEDAEEDNHVPNGVVRNFWRPVAENLVGYECPCKETEPAIVEDKGDFVWRGAPD